MLDWRVVMRFGDVEQKLNAAWGMYEVRSAIIPRDLNSGSGRRRLV